MGRQFISNAKGVGIQSIAKEYYLSTSATVLENGSWLDYVPVLETGKYLWSKWKVVLTNGTIEETEALQEGIAGEELESLAGSVQNLVGGSEGNPIVNARQNMVFLGHNPTSDDEMLSWKNLGTGIAFIDNAGLPNGGFLINMVSGDTVFQILYDINVGQTWRRDGYHNVWNYGWISEYRKRKVWEDDGTASFGAKTISLDLADDEEVEIEYKTTTSSSFYWTTTVKMGRSGQLIAFAQQGSDGASTLMVSRQVSVTSTGVTFKDAEQKNLDAKAVTVANGTAIPVTIWASRGIQPREDIW